MAQSEEGSMLGVLFHDLPKVLGRSKPTPPEVSVNETVVTVAVFRQADPVRDFHYSVTFISKGEKKFGQGEEPLFICTTTLATRNGDPVIHSIRQIAREEAHRHGLVFVRHLNFTPWD